MCVHQDILPNIETQGLISFDIYSISAGNWIDLVQSKKIQNFFIATNFFIF